MAKYTIETKTAGMYTVMYEDFPIAIFKTLIDAEQYQYYLEAGKMASMEVETIKAKQA